MGNTDKKPDERLKEKVDDEYKRYMDHVKRLPDEKIPQNHLEIFTMKSLHTFLTEYAVFDDNVTEWMLSADNTLGVLCEQLLKNDKDISDNINQNLWNHCDPPELSEDDEADEDEYEQGDE